MKEVNYKMIIYPVETVDGKEYIAEFPELKYCSGSGQTIQEATENALSNLEIYLQDAIDSGEKLPQPLEAKFSGKFTVRISKTLHKAAVMKAESDGISLNQLVVESIAQRTFDNSDKIDKFENIIEKFTKIIDSANIMEKQSRIVDNLQLNSNLWEKFDLKEKERLCYEN